MPGTEGYRRPARWMHWLIAVLVLLMIPAGLIMVQKGLPRPVQDTLFIFHKNTGVILFLLMVLRLAYRWRYPPPPLPGSVPGWQRLAAHVTHIGLYVLLIVMPISGYVRVRAGGFPIEGLDALGIGTLLPKSEALATAAQSVHITCAFLLMALIGLHVAAALQHALIRRDGIWSRIWPP
ncbi:cytochrome b [Paracoccus xiamenensis]|uniref:cytochrome b n=1 Tax=Paracoccus xiamenensis TaxID=2714901 RepID=UPI002E27CA64|nr:cytochrome b [Paracoccus xiamenensis]